MMRSITSTRTSSVVGEKTEKVYEFAPPPAVENTGLVGCPFATAVLNTWRRGGEAARGRGGETPHAVGRAGLSRVIGSGAGHDLLWGAVKTQSHVRSSPGGEHAAEDPSLLLLQLLALVHRHGE